MTDPSASSEFRAVLSRELPPIFGASSGQLDRLAAHYGLMLRWNQRLNLTRVTGVSEAVHKHYCEAAVVASLVPSGPLRIADVGSGAGFPGLPLAILRSDLNVTLIEAHQRKAVFLREASRGIQNVLVAGCRAETLQQDSFDWAVSRAVRFEDVLSAKLAPKVILLLSEADCSRATVVEGFDWKIVKHDAGGDPLWIAIGVAAVPPANVPRETIRA